MYINKWVKALVHYSFGGISHINKWPSEHKAACLGGIYSSFFVVVKTTKPLTSPSPHLQLRRADSFRET